MTIEKSGDVITSALISFLLYIPDQFIKLLPTSAPLGINAAATSVVSSGFFNYFGWINDYVPLAEVITLIGTVFAILTVMYVARVGLWIYHQFWGND